MKKLLDISPRHVELRCGPAHGVTERRLPIEKTKEVGENGLRHGRSSEKDCENITQQAAENQRKGNVDPVFMLGLHAAPFLQ